MDNLADHILIDTKPSLPSNASEIEVAVKTPKKKKKNSMLKRNKNKSKKYVQKNHNQQNKINYDKKYKLIQGSKNITDFDEEERRYTELLFNSDDETEAKAEETTTVETELTSTQKRKAVWEDEEDLVSVKEVVKSYSKAKSNDRIINGEGKYQENLREKFTTVYGNTPQWAQIGKKAKVGDDSDSADEDEDWDPEKKTTVYLSKENWGKLEKSNLAFKPVDDLNKGTDQGKIIKSIDFIGKLKIALVAGHSSEKYGAVSLFQFNGKENYKITTIAFPNFPIKCAKFLQSQQRFVVGCNLYPRFYAYDIEDGRKIDVFVHHPTEKSSSKLFEISPDDKYIAFVKNGGLLDIYDANLLTPFETLRVPCEVKAITFSPDSSTLYTIGDNGQVYIFDLNEWSCQHAFYDEGCVEGTAIAMAPNGLLLACGSSSGIINIYQTSSLSSSVNPKPIKTIGSLVTTVTSLVFNSTSEILAAASSFKDNAIKLIHTGSLTVFANFPGSLTYKRVHSISFSPDSKYLVTGDDNKRARLCRLLHY